MTPPRPKGPKSTAKGYGWRHQRVRKRLEPKVAAGVMRCARCGRPIRPTDLWDLDHSDDCNAYLGLQPGN